MNLIIDIGNTQIKVALFKHNELGTALKFSNAEEATEYIRAIHFQRFIISSVNQSISELILKSLKENGIILNHKTRVPLINNYQTPETLGMDRLSAVIGAQALSPSQNCLVIDAGTCIKYDFIDMHAVYSGGTISPGLNMRLKAMHQFTSALPDIQLQDIDRYYGVNTKEAMLSGAVNGAIFEILGFMEKHSELHPDIKIYLTGGDANFFESKIKQHIFVVPNLVLLGLNRILEFNEQ
jgi:type III pantothenate kinase